jgi:hypothetical protein
MCQTALIALLVIASWPALVTASETIKYQRASAPLAAKRHIARKIAKRSVVKASGAYVMILGVGY